MKQSAPRPANKRSEARKVAYAGGRILYPDKATFLDCTILDTSASGARVRLGHRGALPPSFYLLNVRDRSVHEAATAWVKAEHAGLRFNISYPLDSELPAKLDFVRKHWIECATR